MTRSSVVPVGPVSESTRWPVYLRLCSVPAIWGGTFIAGRLVSGHMSAPTAAFLRFVFAVAAMLVALQVSQGLGALWRISRRQLLSTMLLGATGIFAYNLLFFGALGLIPASRTSMLVALNPVVTILLAAALGQERLHWLRWLGVCLALLGVWGVVTDGDLSQLAQHVGRGELLMLGAVLAWAVYTLLGRKVLQGMSPLLATTWASIWGMLLLGLLAAPGMWVFDWAALDGTVWACLAYLGVMGTAVGFVWYYDGIVQVGAARAVVFNNLVPVFGVLFGWLLLGEALRPALFVGGGLAILGVFLVNRPQVERGAAPAGAGRP